MTENSFKILEVVKNVRIFLNKVKKWQKMDQKSVKMSDIFLELKSVVTSRKW